MKSKKPAPPLAHGKHVYPGEMYGRLMVLYDSGKRTNKGEVIHVCQCTCPIGGIVEVKTSHLTTGNTRSCGCLLTEYFVTQDSVIHNVDACRIIDEYGARHGYNFQHAENGGEYRVLKYFLDGYDFQRITAIEVDEPQHYEFGRLRDKDVKRQIAIMRALRCTFIRIRITRLGTLLEEPRIWTPGQFPELHDKRTHGILQMV